MTVIVVGVDGSPEGRAALAWALDEAAVRGATLRAVHAWCIPDDELHPLIQLTTREEAARALLRVELDSAGADTDRVDEVVQPGDPVEVIKAASRDADMVVVGSRGRGSFAALVLRSVAADLVHHAAWPVVIVPHRHADS